MENIKSAGYMIQDIQGTAIYGVGATVSEAWAQVVAEHDGPWTDFNDEVIDPHIVYLTRYKTYGATQALMDYVAANGGDIVWEVINGVACLPR